MWKHPQTKAIRLVLPQVPPSKKSEAAHANLPSRALQHEQQPITIVPDPPIPYCNIYGELKAATLERKQCIAKGCPNFGWLTKIVRWKDGE